MGSGFGQLIAAESPQFERDILPVFYHHCFACHSEKQAKPKGKLRLDSAEAIRASDVIVPGKPDDSELMKRVSLPHTDFLWKRQSLLGPPTAKNQRNLPQHPCPQSARSWKRRVGR